MQRDKLPKTLAPNRQWELTLTRGGVLQYKLWDSNTVVAILKWYAHQGWKLHCMVPIDIALGRHDEPPFEIAEALYDAVK